MVYSFPTVLGLSWMFSSSHLGLRPLISCLRLDGPSGLAHEAQASQRAEHLSCGAGPRGSQLSLSSSSRCSLTQELSSRHTELDSDDPDVGRPSQSSEDPPAIPPHPLLHSLFSSNVFTQLVDIFIGTCCEPALWSAWDLSMSKNKEKSLSSWRSDWEVEGMGGGGVLIDNKTN